MSAEQPTPSTSADENLAALRRLLSDPSRRASDRSTYDQRKPRLRAERRGGGDRS